MINLPIAWPLQDVSSIIPPGGGSPGSLAQFDSTGLKLENYSLTATTEALEKFANTDARFFAELGVPNDQAGWVDVAIAPATITIVTQELFGQTRKVVKHFDDGSSSTSSKFALSVQKWASINTFGASFGTVSRLDTVDGANGFFTGLQANATENPLLTGNRRYGIIFNSSGMGFLQITPIGDAGVVMNGTAGNPKILFDEAFKWEVVVPAGLGAGVIFINDILTTLLAPGFEVNAGGLGTHATVGSGSSGGVDRVAYHRDFGVTIYEELPTKTFSSASMQSTTASMFIPPGRRDYVITVPDGNPRNLGDVLAFMAQNVGGKITIKTQNVSVPQSLFIGENELDIPITVTGSITLINTVDNANIYEFKDPPAQPDDLSPLYVSIADETVSNTTVVSTTIGTGEGNLTVKGNSLKVGDCFQFRAGGILSAGASPTLRLKLMFGALFIGDSGAVVISDITNGHWVLEGTATVRSIGQAGTISVEGGLTTHAGDHFGFTFLVPTVVDTTINNNLDITAQWGTASTGNTITGQNVSIIKVLSP